MGKEAAKKRTKLEKLVDAYRLVLVISAHRRHARVRYHVGFCARYSGFPLPSWMAGPWRRLRSSSVVHGDQEGRGRNPVAIASSARLLVVSASTWQSRLCGRSPRTVTGCEFGFAVKDCGGGRGILDVSSRSFAATQAYVRSSTPVSVATQDLRMQLGLLW